MSYTIEQRDSDVLNSTAAITYELDFSRASQHLVVVTMIIRNINSDVTVVTMPTWTPGSYKIRDYVSNQGNLIVYRNQGTERAGVSFGWRDKASIVIDTKGMDEIIVEYVVYGYERSVRTNHINRNHAFIVPAATLMYVVGRTQEMHHVQLVRDTQRWPTVSTALSPVNDTKNSDGLFGAINYDVLADSPIEIGSHHVAEFESNGAQHQVAVYSTQPVDVEWLALQTQRIVQVEADIFDGVPYDRYVFIVHVYPGGAGGLEHARGSVNAIDPKTFLDKGSVNKLLSLLCHEYFHTWNIKRIRPAELGPFDYQKEVYTPMLWLAEGLTSYYDDLLHYRCGFATETEYLNTLANEHILKLMRIPGRHAMSIRESSFLAWVKLYQAGADGTNRFPSYYLAGGVVMLLLDLHIIVHTDGRRTLDDALRALWQRYLQNPAVGLTEDETIAIMERSTQVQFRDLLLNWLNGVTELPLAEKLLGVGCILTVSSRKADQISFGENREFANVPAAVFAGWTLVNNQGSVTVRAVEDGGPAQIAGIGIDDELLAINGNRIRSADHVEQLLAAMSGNQVAVTAHTDGTMYTTTLTTVPDTVVTITAVTDPSPQQTMNKQTWLARKIG